MPADTDFREKPDIRDVFPRCVELLAIYLTPASLQSRSRRLLMLFLFCRGCYVSFIAFFALTLTCNIIFTVVLVYCLSLKMMLLMCPWVGRR